MLSNQVLSFLGLISRARKISSGETLLKDIRQNRVSFVLIAQDASEGSIKKITNKCKFYHIDFMVLGSVNEISSAIGKDNRVAIGVLDKGFSDSLKKKIGG